ncbi:OLC1v1023021C1 [Oldenlandia corymbosa var. corymbosa]|uniref:OLC1v1023021C1 n=1 Tax=Oldenlandia corymbosa var. corymbosa TaxID=529605 RepID=A0AAV1C1Z8_OLDCO|nr:OLC1v1023021C1 [Oldenlandia corymbosa var. corymbosa]
MNLFKPSQDHAEVSDQHEQENPGAENVGGGKEMRGDNVKREDDVGSSRVSYTPHDLSPLLSEENQQQEQGVRKSDRPRNPLDGGGGGGQPGVPAAEQWDHHISKGEEGGQKR